MRVLELAQYISREAIRIGYTHSLPIKHSQISESKYLTVIFNPVGKEVDPKLRLIIRVSEHEPGARTLSYDYSVRNKPDAGKKIVKILKERLNDVNKA